MSPAAAATLYGGAPGGAMTVPDAVLADLRGLLSPDEYDELCRLAEMWCPLPGPQREAWKSPAFEILYGGAAGGGKSNLVLWLARHEHRRSLLTRKTFPQLEREGGLISESHVLYHGGSYNESKHRWRFNDGCRVEFGFLDDVEDYRGSAFDLFAPDELTELTEFQYLYLFSRVRSTRPGQRCRVLATTNPGGEGEAWVIKRWAPWLDKKHANPAESGEIRWFKREKNDVEVETAPDDPDALSRTFIKAGLKDNPFLMADPTYRKQLMALPEPFRSQLLDGDWTTAQKDNAYQVIPTAWVEAAMARWTPEQPQNIAARIGLDVARGGNDKTVGARRYGRWFPELLVKPGHETPDGAAAAALILPYVSGAASVAVDGFGVGADAYGEVRAATPRCTAILGTESTDDETDRRGVLHFVNLRAAMYWRLRDALDPEQGDDLQLPPDRELLADLTSVRFLPLRARGVQLESKDDTKKRLGRSPDKGDAVALTFATVRSDIAMQAVRTQRRVVRGVF